MSFHKLYRYHNPSVWLGACGCPAAKKKLQQAHILRAVLLLNIRSKAHICMRAVVFFRKYPRRCARHTWIGKVATERHAISEPFSVQFWASPWCFCRPDHPLSIINGMLCGNMDICIYVRWLCYMRWRVSYFSHIFFKYCNYTSEMMAHQMVNAETVRFCELLWMGKPCVAHR